MCQAGSSKLVNVLKLCCWRATFLSRSTNEGEEHDQQQAGAAWRHRTGARRLAADRRAECTRCRATRRDRSIRLTPARRRDRRAHVARREDRARPRALSADGRWQDQQRTDPLGRAYRRHSAARRAAGARERRVVGRRQSGRAAQGRCRHRAPLQPRHRVQLLARDRPGRRGDDRLGSPRQALQRAAGGRREPDARPVERPQLRIYGRGPVARRPARRRTYRRRPVEQDRVDGEAFRAQFTGNRAHDPRRQDRRGKLADERPARLSDRDRARQSGLGHVRL